MHQLHSPTEHQVARLAAAARRQALRDLTPTNEAVGELAAKYIAEALDTRDMRLRVRVSEFLMRD